MGEDAEKRGSMWGLGSWVADCANGCNMRNEKRMDECGEQYGA